MRQRPPEPCVQCSEHMGVALQGLYWLCALLALGIQALRVTK